MVRSGPRGVLRLRAVGMRGVEGGERPQRRHLSLQLRNGLKNALENMVRETRQGVQEDREHRMHPESRPQQGDECDQQPNRQSNPSNTSQKWATNTACSTERVPPEPETTQNSKIKFSRVRCGGQRLAAAAKRVDSALFRSHFWHFHMPSDKE